MMINRPIVYSEAAQRHVNTFDGKSTHWDGMCVVRKAFRKEVRDYYRNEQGYTCPYCGRLREEFHGGQWDIDHIVPKSSHPEYLYTPKNLAVTCKDCNTFKNKQDPLLVELLQDTPYPEEKECYKIIHPHFDSYQEHLKLTRDRKGHSCHEVLSDKGRETFHACHLIRFSEAFSGTSEYVEELGIDIGITGGVSDKVQNWLDEFDALSAHDAQVALQAIMQKLNAP